MNPLEIITQKLPEQSTGKVKAIQVHLRSALIVRFATTEEYHSQILESLLKETKTPYRVGELESGEYGVLPDEEEYLLIGAGVANVNLESKTISFEGLSTAYNIGWDRHVLRARESLPEWDVRAYTLSRRPIA